MALVQSRQHKVYKTKWSHSCQPRWLWVSLDTLVQEGNYLSHARHTWQGDTPKIFAHLTKTAVSAEWDHPYIVSWGSSSLAIRGAKTLIKRPRRVEFTTLKGVTEAGSRPLLRQLSSTHQNDAPRHADLPWHQPPEALPFWSEDFICPAAHLALEILPCKMLTTPLPTVLSPGPAHWDLGLRFLILHWLLYVCYISLRLLACE